MCNLTLNENGPKPDKLKRKLGDKSYPIWLLVNPKHPAVIRNIWTPVLTEIQDRVYREMHARVDTHHVYIRNAVERCETVPTNTLNWWGVEVAAEVESFREVVLRYRPKFLISFGAFPFEFARRVLEIKPEKGSRAWSNYKLEAEFKQSIENFDINRTNAIPLLRRMMTNGKKTRQRDDNCWLDSEGYFRYVGTELADKIIYNKDSLDIWLA